MFVAEEVGVTTDMVAIPARKIEIAVDNLVDGLSDTVFPSD